jgi:pantoate--beta-alanine ligase
MSINCAENKMLILETINDFKHWHNQQEGTLALIPTMGALHEGHLSLIRKAKTLADKVVLYIFVNPMQFGPKEDFGTYPRTAEADLTACQKEGVDAVFMPQLSDIYPDGKDNCTKIVPPSSLGDILEGHFRPGFFTGVATVLVKFFNIVQPNVVVFGEKDYQQLLVVRRFVADLDLPITIYGAATVREPDGLALSSRNAYLNKEQRALAPKILILLQEGASIINAKPAKTAKIAEEIDNALFPIRQKFKEAHFDLQYLEAKDADNLQIITAQTKRIILLVAAKIDNIRLIDNLYVN